MTSRSPAVKRLMKEFKDLETDPSPELIAKPLDDNVFEWHFTLRGPPEGGFQGGRYHGLKWARKYVLVLLGFIPSSGDLHGVGVYPFNYLGVRSALVALISFMLTDGDGAVGALDYDVETRKVYALKSKSWCCPSCGSNNANCLPDESEAPSQILEPEPELTFSIKDNQSSESISDINEPTQVTSVSEPIRQRRIPETRTIPPVFNAAAPSIYDNRMLIAVIVLIGVILLRRVILFSIDYLHSS